MHFHIAYLFEGHHRFDSLTPNQFKMDPYDSDSSIDEDFTDTGVLLGYAAEDVIEDVISHLGGWPVCYYEGLLCIINSN